jgi:hypothetical protein
MVCLNGSCEEGDDDDDDDSGPAGPTARSHFIWLGGGVDFLFLSSATEVCGEGDIVPEVDFKSGPDNYFCYEEGGEFIGIPAKADNTNEVLGGGAFAGGRVLVGYDYMVWDGGLTVGARLGVGISTMPSGAGDAVDRAADCPDANNGSDATCRDPADKKFLMFHGEARAAYHIGGSEGFLDGLLRPYAFVGGGVAQVNSGVDVKICDRLDENGVASTDDNPSCRNAGAANTRRTDVKAVQVTGLGFVGVGVGSIFAFHDNFGAFVELKAMFMVPTFGAVIAPSIGPVALF